MPDSVHSLKLRNTLQSLFDEINFASRHCVSYRSCDQVIGSPLVLSGGWEGADKIYESRDSISYRAPALEWHVQRIREVGQQEINKMAATGTYAHLIDPNMIHHALARLRWAFDDLIFNAVSLLDYCAKFICSAGITSRKPNQYDWSNLNKPKNREKLDHALLKSVLIEEHENWFVPLQSLRSHVIHNKAEVGRMTLSSGVTNGVPTLSAEYFVAEKAVSSLPIFENDVKVDLEDGAALIAIRTVESVRKVVNTMSKLEYVALHDPRCKDRWCNPIPNAIDRVIGES